MKKVVSLLLVLCLLLGLTACGNEPVETEDTPTEKKTTTTTAPEETDIALPFGLKFGMSYDEFAAKLSENGLTANPLKPATDQPGYKPDVMPLPTDDPSIWKFTGSKLLQNLSGKEYHLTADEEESTLFMHQLIYRNSTPCVYAFFNQKKELSQFGFIGLYTNEKFETATQYFIKALAADITPYYDAFFGIGGELNDCTSYWENDKYSVMFYQPTTGCYALIIKDNAYDADTAPLPEEGTSKSSSHSTTAGKTTIGPTDGQSAQTTPTQNKPTATNHPTQNKPASTQNKPIPTQNKPTTPTPTQNQDPCAHGHDWEAIYDTVHYEEKGHYETVISGYNTVTSYKCAMCYEAFSSLNAYYSHFAQHEASSGNSASFFKERYETVTEQEPIYREEWVVDQEEETVEEIIGYECRVCGKKKN
ncbi:MAG: hypothetical protein IJB36_02695 [Clostridia bacterium]|nr:hypothetical protein [Clostridia bacterium]